MEISSYLSNTTITRDIDMLTLIYRDAFTLTMYSVTFLNVLLYFYDKWNALQPRKMVSPDFKMLCAGQTLSWHKSKRLHYQWGNVDLLQWNNQLIILGSTAVYYQSLFLLVRYEGVWFSSHGICHITVVKMRMVNNPWCCHIYLGNSNVPLQLNSGLV